LLFGIFVQKVIETTEDRKSMTTFYYTANVYRYLQGVYREIRVRGFQIFGDCMIPAIPVILKSPHSDFHCNYILKEFDFTGILWGHPTLDVGKSCINYGETM
jgi:hypothetical protein